ncbi:trans-aconitate 2-methyltransferase [Collimonas arenae]|uniref:Trans-aconitate 2-methyltransferase n=1 Tax=Collimonas arenae TaxID=279058 RepID=A0A127QK78_9BURK|nr:methyltransferase domain-containing protein [Collimonas arenae]AMP10185.1 trans-aconitate 2-methyltransferase [Collimonas arenae]
MDTSKDIWDAKQYMHFGNERLRPALDLLAYIPDQEPKHVVDLGCGTGNITALLKARWAHADVLGIDSSQNMLDKATATAPECRFLRADLGEWKAPQQVDVLYTNAALQWLPDHPSLFPHLLSSIRPGGWLAAQMPAMHNEPLRQMQGELADSPAFAPYLKDLRRQPPILNADEYYDLLRSRAASLDIWETTYLHTLKGDDAVTEWAAGTSLRPYLEALPSGPREAFRDAYSAAMMQAYPQRENGVTLLPFKRLFIIANV